MIQKLMLAALATSCLAGTAFAETWSCRNSDFEITCDKDACQAAESFTPMDISLSRSRLGICAYSGCWEGSPTTILETGPYMIATGLSLPFSTQTDAETDVALTLDRTASVATLIVGGSYTLPLRCRRTGLSGTTVEPAE